MTTPGSDALLLSALRPRPDYRLTRRVLLQSLAFIQAVAFWILVQQQAALLGSRGLLPVQVFLQRVTDYLGSPSAGFWRLPSLFWLNGSDSALSFGAWTGFALALAGCLGYGNAISFALLWALYLSFTHVGQIFYGYGWDILLCEASFLAIFLAPPREWRLRRAGEPELVLIVLFRWLTFRLMFGAGLIKVRGDACWTDLTCLLYHYETQPNPNLLSPYLHRMPAFAHRACVLFNHVVELVAPFGVFGPRRVRYVAGGLIVLFQLFLIASGNLSFLNWLTIAIALACFDDAAFVKLSTLLRLDRLRRLDPRTERAEPAPAPSRERRAVVYALAVVIAVLSFNPIVNLLSPRQAMNASFEPFKLVNTYGAFGSVGQIRNEVIFEGTSAAELGPDTRWLEFGFPCKPGDPARLPCQISPYHYRLDWQMWFLAMGPIQRDPWAIHLIYKLLEGDRTIDPLIQNPFPDRPPRFVRARLYRYRFAKSSEPGVWVRSYLTEYVRPLTRDDPELLDYVRHHGFVE